MIIGCVDERKSLSFLKTFRKIAIKNQKQRFSSKFGRKVAWQRSGEFDDFEVFDVGSVDDETDERADGLLSVGAFCTWIDDECVKPFVVHDAEDMAVSANEEFGW